MNLNELMMVKNFDATRVLVFRHCPYEPGLKKVLPWLAEDQPGLFNAYQQTQGEKLESAMKTLSGEGYVASFVGLEPGKAHFVGLYSIGAFRPLSLKEYWEVPAYAVLKSHGMVGFTEAEGRPSVLWFDLQPVDFYPTWKGKLVVSWPPPERSWWRRAHRNEMTVLSVLEESAFAPATSGWDEISLTWDELGILPARLRAALSEWRGIYYIFDISDGKGYVGAAYGDSNLFGRWQHYAKSGHGDNRQLRHREPRNFRFTILQRVSPDMDKTDVIRLETTWKLRLHTRMPFGLNDN